MTMPAKSIIKDGGLDKVPLPGPDSKSVQVDYYRVALVVAENISYISITMNHARRECKVQSAVPFAQVPEKFLKEYPVFIG